MRKSLAVECVLRAVWRGIPVRVAFGMVPGKCFRLFCGVPVNNWFRISRPAVEGPMSYGQTGG